MKTFLCWLISRAPEAVFCLEILVLYIIKEEHIIISDLLSDKNIMLKFLILAGTLSIILPIVIMIYTYRNFDEVISRQFKWRNSNVEKFSYKLKYSWNRFMITLAVCLLASFIVGFLNFKA